MEHFDITGSYSGSGESWSDMCKGWCEGHEGLICALLIVSVILNIYYVWKMSKQTFTLERYYDGAGANPAVLVAGTTGLSPGNSATGRAYKQFPGQSGILNLGSGSVNQQISSGLGVVETSTAAQTNTAYDIGCGSTSNMNIYDWEVANASIPEPFMPGDYKHGLPTKQHFYPSGEIPEHRLRPY